MAKPKEEEYIYTQEDMKYVTMAAMRRIREREEERDRAEVMIRCIIDAMGGEVVIPAKNFISPNKYLYREDSPVDFSVKLSTGNTRKKGRG